MPSQLLLAPLVRRQRRNARIRNRAEENRRPTDLSLLCQKTKLCTFNSQGSCVRGNMCTYAHSEQELRKPPNLSQTKLCPALVNGRDCPDRITCLFAHEVDETKQHDCKQAFQTSRTVLASSEQIGLLQILPVMTAGWAYLAETNSGLPNVVLSDDVIREAKYFARENEKHHETHIEADSWSQRSTVDSDCYLRNNASPECSDDEASCKLQSFGSNRFGGIEVRVKNTFFHFGADSSTTKDSVRRSTSMPSGARSSR